MYGHLFGLSENPFGADHDPRFVFHHAKRDEMVALMRKRIAEGESFITMTGESGCGKTSVVSEVLEFADLNARVAFIAHPSLTPSELLEAVCIEFGAPLPNPPSKPQTLAALEHHLRGLKRQGHHAVLVLDEAHGLKTELLEEVRLLSNMKGDGRGVLQTLLVGLPELERRLGLPELAQLRQRIAVHCRMAPLTREETAGYVRHRIDAAGGDAAALFPDETCEEIHAYTNGFPRDINTIAGRALEHAEQEGAPVISVDHVRMAAGDVRPGIATVQRAPSAAQPFELKRKAGSSRVPAEPARTPEPVVEKPVAPPPVVRTTPSFLRAQQTARTGPPAEVRPPAASMSGSSGMHNLEDRFRNGEVTERELAIERPGRSAGTPGRPMPILASEGVQELGASVLLAGLMVVALIASGQWNPLPPPASRPTDVETASATDPITPMSTLAGTVPAEALLDPGTALPAPAPAPPEPAPAMLQPVRPTPIGGRQAYGFEVASSNHPDSAAAVLKSITRGSKVPCRIVAKTTGDTYRVVVGPFATRLEATRAINGLLKTTLIKRAQLVQIPE